MPPAESEGNLSLEDAASYMLEECRMVLPGIQSLFGFQLIAVFNQAFSTRLSGFEQKLHLGAIVLVVVSIALVMAPAALHRQREPRSVSENFLAVSSRLLLWSMLPLALGISLDVFLVSRVILRSSTGALALAGVLFGVFVLLWYGLPRRRVMRRLAQR
jgi:uncharacterized membrane protein YidH (DUF202 family)